MRFTQPFRRAPRSRVTLLAAAVASALALTAMPAQAAPLPGAIFTTDVGCTGVNINIFTDKGDVYLDGGPSHPGAAGLPDGEYYVQVTTPNGTVLGTSVGAADETPYVVTGGNANCIQLAAVLIRPDASPGYADTDNPGGVYKVWVSTVSTFPNDSSKTDNFKAPNDGVVPPQEDEAQLHVRKFYDANTNGVQDGLEGLITGWKINIQDDLNIDRFTPVDLILQPDDYVVTEYLPLETNWLLTTPPAARNVTLADGDDTTVTFGNVCLGAGGGLTLGFWSNKNGGKVLSANGNAILTQVLALNLRKANGSLLGSVSLANFQKFLLEANASNMANMLSAQLAAMKANVASLGVGATSLIYAPQVIGANAAGFVTVQAVMDQANASLALFGLTPSGHAERANQEVLKTALDRANNNLNFAQAAPCPFTFP